MSRSFKCNPVRKKVKKRFNKCMANKKVRKTIDISNGRSYRRVYNTYNISDYRVSYFTDDHKKIFYNYHNNNYYKLIIK
jgi:hypothetical protein